MGTTVNIDTLLQNFGPTSALILLGAFFWKGVWPIIRKQLEDAKEERAKFLEALERRDKEFSEFARGFDKLDGATQRIDITTQRIYDKLDQAEAK